MFGYFGRYLRCDLDARTVALAPLAEKELRGVIGGVGLGAWILGREMDPACDVWSSRSALVFALSPLVGTPLTTSAKFAVVGKSPLTGRICDALASSHFALAAKRTGIDALVLVGRSESPGLLWIEDANIDTGESEGIPEEWRLRPLSEDFPIRVWLEPAGRMWGRSAADVGRALAERERERERDRGGSGKEAWRVSAIGRAGELRIPYATISHEGRHAGRGGLGAILGDKRIKAIAVRGRQKAPLADPARVTALARDLSARSFGPATEKYRVLGTVANLLVFNRFDALPTRNFQEGRFEEAENLVAVNLAPARAIARHSCAACTIGCEHIFALKDKDGGGTSGVRLEYESLFALGPLCGISDPEIVLRAAAWCDEFGVDTISLGGTLAFLMECVERGWVDGRFSGGTLRFGDGVGMIEFLEAFAACVGKTETKTETESGVGRLGALLALGSRAAAATLGAEAEALAPHVKGLELPGYDPRALHTMALGLAVNSRGADHNRSSAYDADFRGDVDRLGDDPERHAQLAIRTEDKSALWDSLILCKFLRGVFTDVFAESAAFLEAVTGWDMTAEELETAMVRIVTLRKQFNILAGWTRNEDALPSRLFTPASDSVSDDTVSDAPQSPVSFPKYPGFTNFSRSAESPRLTRRQLEDMIFAYYRQRGWTPEGLVPERLLRELGIPVTTDASGES